MRTTSTEKQREDKDDQRSHNQVLLLLVASLLRLFVSICFSVGKAPTRPNCNLDCYILTLPHRTFVNPDHFDSDATHGCLCRHAKTSAYIEGYRYRLATSAFPIENSTSEICGPEKLFGGLPTVRQTPFPGWHNSLTCYRITLVVHVLFLGAP